MSISPLCPYCNMPVTIDYETGLITECLGCEKGVGCYPIYKEDDWDILTNNEWNFEVVR